MTEWSAHGPDRRPAGTASVPTSGDPAPIVVGVVGPDPRLAEELATAFAVRTLPLDGNPSGRDYLACDVLVVSARDAPRYRDAARLAASDHVTVVCGAGGEVDAAMRSLDLGAVDYLSWGMSPEERVARIRSAARYVRRDRRDWLLVGDVAISIRRQEVRRGGERIRLTPHEFGILEALAASPGMVVSHHELMARVWGAGAVNGRNYLRIYPPSCGRSSRSIPHAHASS